MSTEATWNGKPLSEYTKEELIGIVLDMNRRLEAAREDHGRTLETWRTFEAARRESPMERLAKVFLG